MQRDVDASDNEKLSERSSPSSYTSFDYTSTDNTEEYSGDWVSYESQGCSKDGLGHPSPASTPYNVSDVQDIDWSLEKACWISDKYVRYCDQLWRVEADSPRKCLEECQNHPHCQKAVWFLRESDNPNWNAGDPNCAMFPVGAAECDWDGGQYVRPAKGQTIQCQGPICGQAESEADCWAGDHNPTYCKYTQKSNEEIAEMTASGDWSTASESSSLSDRSQIGYSPYYTGASDNYEYRCAACPKEPWQCSYDVYFNKYYPDKEVYDGSLEINFHEEGWAECITNCFKMDYNTCNDDGCDCLSSTEYNYQEIDQFGSFGASNAFASWNSAGCAHNEVIVTPPSRCWFADGFDFYCDDAFGSFETETAEDCLLECTNNSTCYRAAWHPARSSTSENTYESTSDSGSGDISAICYMFQVGSQKCSWNEYVKKPDDARMIQCIGEPCDWNYGGESGSSEYHGGCGLQGQRAFCDLNSALGSPAVESMEFTPDFYTSSNDDIEYRCETCPERPSGCDDQVEQLNGEHENEDQIMEWVSFNFNLIFTSHF